MEKVQEVLEIERAVNLLKAFGWEKSKETVEADSITLTFVKLQQVTPPASPK